MDYLINIKQICDNYEIGVITQNEALYQIAVEFFKASEDDTEKGYNIIAELQSALKIIL